METNNNRAETPDFKFFVTTLALQAAINLGQLENPSTRKKEENFPQAKFIIGTLDMLREKTKANLTKEETELLDSILNELKTQYTSLTTRNFIPPKAGSRTSL